MWRNTHILSAIQAFDIDEPFAYNTYQYLPEIIESTPLFHNPLHSCTGYSGIALRSVFMEYAQYLREKNIHLVTIDRFDTKTSKGKKFMDDFNEHSERVLAALPIQKNYDVYVHSILPFFLVRAMISDLSGMWMIMLLLDSTDLEMRKKFRGMSSAFCEDSRLVFTELLQGFKGIVAGFSEDSLKNKSSIIVDLVLGGGQKLIADFLISSITDVTPEQLFLKTKDLWNKLSRCKQKAIIDEDYVKDYPLDAEHSPIEWK